MSDKQDNQKRKDNKEQSQDYEELEPLSLHPYDLEEALRRLLKVDPEKVEERLEKEKEARKRKKEGN